MKYIYNVLILLFLSFSIIAQTPLINPNWSFVGPKSENQQNGNKFWPSHINRIAVDPSNSSHFVVASVFAGLWQTSDAGANWAPINSIPIGIGGSRAVAFRNNNELYVGSYFNTFSSRNYSSGVYKYTFSTSSWSVLGNIPEPAQSYIIERIVFYPGNSNIVFVCTSSGLYRSTDAGLNWSKVTSVVGSVGSMSFIKKSNGVDYFCYVAGSTVVGKEYQGNALLMESLDNGATFNTVSSFMNNFTNPNYFGSYAGICLGNQTLPNGDRDIYISTAVNKSNPNVSNPPPPWASNERQLHRLRKNINSNTVIVSAVLSPYAVNEYWSGPGRLSIAYDPTNNFVLTGGVWLHAVDLNTSLEYTQERDVINSIPTNPNKGIHDDVNDLYFLNGSILAVCDGSFYKGNFSSTSSRKYLWERYNNKLDVCLINGFSGTSDNPNGYVMGMQDMLMTDYYDASIGKTTYQHFSGENDGGIIDKFNNNLIITDYESGGNTSYYVTNNGPTGFESSQVFSTYLPNTSPSYYLEPDINPLTGTQEFGYHPFFQDPFRANRIYNTAKGASVAQLDMVSNKFVWKFRLQDELSHFSNSPTYLSQDAYAGAAYGIHYIGWETNITGMSFSQIDKNSVYCLTRNRFEFGQQNSVSQVAKYIGPDFDDMWFGHNEHRSANGSTPYWQLVTPDWQSLTTVSTPDLFNICLTGVETSNWDKNSIYVSCSSRTSGFPIKIVKGNTENYPPIWEDYSTGIPLDENIFSMTMDHASNDGIYVSTEKGVYFRDASMGAWVPYKTNMPVVNTLQMEINYKENTVRVGTYGRGIWKSQLACPSQSLKAFNNIGIAPMYFEANNITADNSQTSQVGRTIFRATNSIILNPGFISQVSTTDDSFQAFIHGCVTGSSTSAYEYYKTTSPQVDELIKDLEVSNNKLIVYPNPNSGIFTLQFNDDKYHDNLFGYRSVFIYNSIGEKIYSLLNTPSTIPQVDIDIKSYPSGVYFIRVVQEGEEVKNTKIIKQ